MYQKYFAYHTLMMLLSVLVLEFFGVGTFNITQDDFSSVLGKLFYLILVVWLVIPVILNWLSMTNNSLNKGKWLWSILALIFGPFATVPYYFFIYRK